MVYKFRLLSDEVDNFRRDIEIDSEATFLDLNNAILKSVNYPDDQMTSFFICTDRWIKEVEITREDMGGMSEEENYAMADTVIGDLVEDEKQKLMYVFDPLADRAFFMELRETSFGEDLETAICTKKVGDAPAQMVDFEEIEKKLVAQQVVGDDLDADFYGADEYDISELDDESFGSYDPTMDF